MDIATASPAGLDVLASAAAAAEQGGTTPSTKPLSHVSPLRKLLQQLPSTATDAQREAVKSIPCLTALDMIDTQLEPKNSATQESKEGFEYIRPRGWLRLRRARSQPVKEGLMPHYDNFFLNPRGGVAHTATQAMQDEIAGVVSRKVGVRAAAKGLGTQRPSVAGVKRRRDNAPALGPGAGAPPPAALDTNAVWTHPAGVPGSMTYVRFPVAHLGAAGFALPPRIGLVVQQPRSMGAPPVGAGAPAAGAGTPAAGAGAGAPAAGAGAGAGVGAGAPSTSAGAGAGAGTPAISAGAGTGAPAAGAGAGAGGPAAPAAPAAVGNRQHQATTVTVTATAAGDGGGAAAGGGDATAAGAADKSGAQQQKQQQPAAAPPTAVGDTGAGAASRYGDIAAAVGLPRQSSPEPDGRKLNVSPAGPGYLLEFQQLQEQYHQPMTRLPLQPLQSQQPPQPQQPQQAQQPQQPSVPPPQQQQQTSSSISIHSISSSGRAPEEHPTEEQEAVDGRQQHVGSSRAADDIMNHPFIAEVLGITAERDELRVERTALQQQCERLREERNALQQQPQRLQEEHTALQQQCERLREERNALRRQRDALQREASTLRAEVEYYQAKYEEQRAILDQL